MNACALQWFLRLYQGVFAFVFAPIIASMVFSFNSDRFPTIPLGSFTFKWYEQVWGNEAMREAMRNSCAGCQCVALTFIGFCTAHTDYRFRFFGKSAYLGLALLPLTIPLVIMGLAMLAWLSRIAGQVWSVVIAHMVLCSPFAMADSP